MIVYVVEITEGSSALPSLEGVVGSFPTEQAAMDHLARHVEVDWQEKLLTCNTIEGIYQSYRYRRGTFGPAGRGGTIDINHLEAESPAAEFSLDHTIIGYRRATGPKLVFARCTDCQRSMRIVRTETEEITLRAMIEAAAHVCPKHDTIVS